MFYKKQMSLLILMLFIFFPLHSFSKNQNVNQDYKNTYKLTGINTNSHLIAYVYGTRNPGKGDIKYQLLIMNYQSNDIVFKSQSEYISSLYNDDSIETDWDDSVYSIETYIELKQNYLNEICSLYSLSSFSADSVIFDKPKTSIESENQNGLMEDVRLKIQFSVDDKLYCCQKDFINSPRVLESSLSVVYEAQDFLIAVIEIKHVGLEEDCIDYEIYGVQR